MPEPVVLGGCAPIPLASYLKGLAVLRIVGEQVDPEARGAWRGDSFVLHSSLDADGLMEFMLQRYRPTPIVAPWNGGSGFYPKDNQNGIGPISSSTSDRFSGYRLTIETARRIQARLGIAEKSADDTKRDFQIACRAELPDAALEWFDAAVVLTSDRTAYPALLGTGGNDGRFDFSNNYMQHLVEVIDPATGASIAAGSDALRGALFGGVYTGLKNLTIGQFNPGGAGGPNSSPGFDAGALVNRWDFILMIEGALLFAAAATRRMGSARSVLACPFSVNATGVGYPSAAASDEKQTSELWVPLWEEPITLSELRALMGEGRAQVGTRAVTTGVDFARAVSTLGVDRGLTAFQRYSFLERNGQSTFALPLARHAVTRQPQVDLLNDLDRGGWLDNVHRRCASDRAPASVQRAVRRLDDSMIALCSQRSRSRMQTVLVRIGDLERALARSLKWTRESFLSPCPPLSAEWLDEADDGSAALHLAVCLAGMFGGTSLRQHLEPITYRGSRATWDEHPSRDVVWHEGDALTVMHAIMARRLLKADDRSFGHGRVRASLGDVAQFLSGQTDAAQVLDLAWGASLIDPQSAWPRASRAKERRMLPALYSLLALCTMRHSLQEGGALIPLIPEMHRRASVGDSSRAATLALRRLQSSGVKVSVTDAYDADRERVRRCAAAMLFPIGPRAMESLSRSLQMQEIEKEPVLT